MTIELTKAEAEQLLSYVHHRDEGSDSGWYYGSKEQFEKRHNRIKTTLYLALTDPK